MSLKDARRLSQKQLRDIALLCATMALLLVAAVYISGGGMRDISSLSLGQPQAAATALGDAQGTPPGFTGNTYPAYTLCYVNWSYADYGPAYGPLCPGIGSSNWGRSSVAQQDTFATGVFSANLGSGQGQSIYVNRTVNSGYTVSSPANPVTCDKWGSCTGGPLCPSGWTHSGGDKYSAGYCSYSYPDTISAPSGSNVVGSQVRALTGQPITLEWSCLPSRTVYGEYKSGTGWFSSGDWYASLIYSFGLSSGVTGSGTGFVPSGLVGSQSVTMPSTPGTYNYNLTCNGGTNAMTIPVTVIAAPSLAISGNGTNPTSVLVGQAVTVTAAFVANGTDALSKTAINDYASNLWCGSGNSCSTAMWTASPLGTKTYTFTPTTAGTYVFYPAAQSTNFPAWNNYGKSLTVTATAPTCANGLTYGTYGPSCTCPSGQVQSGASCVAQCPNGTGPTGSCISCNAGYTLSGGNCIVSTCANGLNYGSYGPSCTCPSGQVQSGASCVVPTCANGLTYGTYGPSCTCPSGQVQSGASCVAAASSIGTFSTSPTRVRKNISTPVTFTYLVTNPPASCTISGPAGFTPVSISPTSGVPGTRVASVTLAQTSVFTLTCGSVSVQSTVGLIPATTEI